MRETKLGQRMRSFYENIPKTKLMRRCPVIIRVDGRSFHQFTKGFKRPFDSILIKSMQETAKYLCENIQGCVLSYQQSDEISLVLVDYKNLNSSAFFDYEIQKLCSITASMATMAFNKIFSENVHEYLYSCLSDDDDNVVKDQEEWDFTTGIYMKAIQRGAMFDARCFNIPKEEVANYIYWRQLDAIRNSIGMVGRAYLSKKQLQGADRFLIQSMLCNEKRIIWNDFPTHLKRGSCCIKERVFVENKNKDSVNAKYCFVNLDDDYEVETGVYRTRWTIDKNIPTFTGHSRRYIERLIMVGEE